MKHIFKRMSFFGLAVFLAACDAADIDRLVNLGSEVKVIVGLPAIETSLTGSIVDAKTQAPLTQKVTLTFSGQNAKDLVNMYSHKLSQQVLDGGLASFGVDNKVVPSATSPVKFTVTASAPGYLTTSQEVVVTAKGGTPFVIPMINPSQAPDGAEVTKNSSAQASPNGQTTQPVTITTTPTTQTEEAKVEVTLPAATPLQTANGTPLSGALTSTLTYINPNEGSAAQALPSGYTIGPDGQAFEMVGAVQMNITDGQGNTAVSGTSGRALGKTSAVTSMTITLPKGVVNPITNRPAQIGDKLAVCIFVDGRWQYINLFEVLAGANSTLVLKVSPAYIGYYIAYFFQVPPANKCRPNATVNFINNGNVGSVSLKVQGSGLNQSVSTDVNGTNTSLILGATNLGYSEINKNARFTLTARTSAGKEVSLKNQLICDGTINMNLPAPETLLNVTVTATPQCPAGKKAYVTSFPIVGILFFPEGKPELARIQSSSTVRWNLDNPTKPKYIINAQFDIDGVLAGKTYVFASSYNGESFSRRLTIPATGATSGRTPVNYAEDISSFGVCQ